MTLQYSDKIFIVSQTTDRMEALKTSIHLRGFDRAKCFRMDDFYLRFQSILAEDTPDLILLDPEGPVLQSVALLQKLSERAEGEHPIPVILLAETFDEDAFLTCYDAGAKDYLVKPVNQAYLTSRILIALDESRLRKNLLQRDLILRDLTVITDKTNIFSKDYFLKSLQREMETLSEEGFVSLLILDVDGYANLSDATQREAIEKIIADCMKHSCRGGDIVGEFYNNQFAIILPNTSILGAHSLSGRIYNKLHLLLSEFSHTHPRSDLSIADFSLSLGISDNKGCQTYEQLIQKALFSLKTFRQDGNKQLA
jgi:diguanylate cyclase (GGDEF)-like protein